MPVVFCNPCIHQHVTGTAIKASDSTSLRKECEVGDTAEVQYGRVFIACKLLRMKCWHQRGAMAARSEITAPKVRNHINASEFRQ